jgi:hypothetical protein
MQSLRVCIIAVLLSFTAGAAQAVPVTWTLQDWTFNDGGSASGSFVYDADTNNFSDMFIATTNGTERTGVIYSEAISGGNTAFSAVPFAGFPSLVSSPNLMVMFADQLTNLGGVVGVFMGQESTCNNAGCTSLTGPIRFLGEGASVSAVPIPAALSLFLSGLAVFGAVARRRRLSGSAQAA